MKTNDVPNYAKDYKNYSVSADITHDTLIKKSAIDQNDDLMQNII